MDIEWENGDLTEVRITSNNGAPLKLAYKHQLIELDTHAGEVLTLNGKLNKIN